MEPDEIILIKYLRRFLCWIQLKLLAEPLEEINKESLVIPIHAVLLSASCPQEHVLISSTDSRWTALQELLPAMGLRGCMLSGVGACLLPLPHTMLSSFLIVLSKQGSKE